MEDKRTRNVSPQRRNSEPQTDAMDSRYFTASPVNMEYPVNSLSGSDRYVNYKVSMGECFHELAQEFELSCDVIRRDSTIYIYHYSVSFLDLKTVMSKHLT